MSPDSEDRLALARYLARVLALTNSALAAALDPDEPEPTANSIRDYTRAARELLGEIDEAIIEDEGGP